MAMDSETPDQSMALGTGLVICHGDRSSPPGTGPVTGPWNRAPVRSETEIDVVLHHQNILPPLPQTG
ncbi:hypothetical protein DPMN_129940 [Dreissena polymorpha]|uniref:Uncharacterized protein n=1 Tax=Dreissena polymorpha TaxID=45954 RepID=A0A9D4K0Z9_DREPO|nr:hypothetical protein DPMN_129940 [Dreissena polymorpha]